MQQEIKDKIINLLRTEKQTTSQLVSKNEEGECSYCIEGVFALAMGGTVVDNPNPNHKSSQICSININGKYESICISDRLLKEHGLPLYVKPSLIKEVLNKTLRESYNWIQLNDNCMFTFKDFEKIIEAL
jgi:hypothetical protein